MTFPVKPTRHRHRVLFPRSPATMPSASASSPNLSSEISASARLDELLYGTTSPDIQSQAQPPSSQPPGLIITELPDDADTSTSSMPTATIPPLFTTLPLIRDLLQTPTSRAQDTTTQTCLPFLSSPLLANRHGIPHLDRPRHVRFLHKTLQGLPAAYVSVDAARPWFFYWALCGLSTLGEDVAPYADRLVQSVRGMQHPQGGFGGGHGQVSHLAPTYAVVLSLAMVGGEARGVVDRRGMWEWLGRLKEADGGFRMSVEGEVDVRGAYCAATMLTLLDLPLEIPESERERLPGMTSLLDGLPEYVSRCQSFEGGIAARPDAEAHGAYVFCALGCLCILGDPHVIISKYLNLPLLVGWLSSRQYAPEGGFAGRTNKLVDGCYSHWIGGSWPLIEAAMKGPSLPTHRKMRFPLAEEHEELSVVNTYYSREAITRYILCCCQDTGRRGGMRDKPGMNSDGYHTCYVLAGLSAAQHKWSFGLSHSGSVPVTGHLSSAYRYTSQKYPVPGPLADEQIFDESDRVCTLHPVFVIPEGAAESMRAYSGGKAV